MPIELNALQKQLAVGDIGGFLASLESLENSAKGCAKMTNLTQYVLPPILRAWLNRPNIPNDVLIKLWSCIHNETLLVIENDLREMVNLKIDSAWIAEYGNDSVSPRKLLMFSEPGQGKAKNRILPNLTKAPVVNELEMRRIVIRSSYLVSFAHTSEIIGAKKNLCASSQEREFLKAVRLFLPGLRAYPNIPLHNFINIERVNEILTIHHRRYNRRAKVDILLCTQDEDPVAGIELDSHFHDSEIATKNDRLKNQLFAMAGIPLVRIRPADTGNVRAEDFYDLLMDQIDIFDKLRPHRIRPRRDHDVIVPT